MQYHKRTQKQTTQNGSFLLELLIAFAIISISMTVVVDSFITSQRSYRTTVEQAELTRVISRILEDMTIEARVSENFDCGSANPSPCNGTLFRMEHIEGLNNQGINEIVSYRLQGTTIQKDYLDGGSNFVDMTPPTIEVTDFNVQIVGSHGSGEQVQALLTMTARDTENPAYEVHMQTSFTERKY